MNELIHLPDVGKVNVHVMGRGPQAVIALHGFSRNGSIFASLARQLSATHTFYALDLPYHGATDWEAERYTPGQLAQVIEDFKVAKQLSSAIYLGHSLGGRILLKLAGNGQLPVVGVSQLITVAPDGLSGNYTGRLDKIPRSLVKMLAWAGGRTGTLLKIAGLLHRRGLFDVYTLQYLQHHLRDARTQRMLLATFRSLPAFRLGVREQMGLMEAGIPITTLVGDRDPLMNATAVQRWFAPLENARVLPYRGHHSLPVDQLARLLTTS